MATQQTQNPQCKPLKEEISIFESILFVLISTGHVRELRYRPLSGDAFRDAMLAPETGLTHAALTGVRKQSVQDAERLLSIHVARWLLNNGHLVEGQYVKV